ncbi:MAG: DUF2155 domain-containing protein [Pseudomonadota bacterium]|nr:DUF2155 domain-containing protein [Pseudomonadota bacterium]
MWRIANALTTGVAAVITCSFTSPCATQQNLDWQAAVLQGLDKITARVSTFNAPVGVGVRFGTLHIMVKRCHKRPPEETPETTAYIKISERRIGSPPKLLFSGWIFSSSPAVSGMEHPVYDVWIVDCKKASSSG